MPNLKSISFKMAVLQGGGQNLPSRCVCYPRDPMWNRVNPLYTHVSRNKTFGSLQVNISGGKITENIT